MNLYPLLIKKYPEGSRGGQCFEFMHKLVVPNNKFPLLGILYSSKYRELLKSGYLDTSIINVGDVILQNYKPYGHGAFVNAVVNGQLQLSESNYNYITKPLKISHTRLISPKDSSITGFWRGDLAFATPIVNYPVQLKVIILFNHPIWASTLKHLSGLQDWFWQASGQRVELIIDLKQTNLSNWETVFTGPVIGGSNMEIIKEEWYDKNILPLTNNSDIVIFNMPSAAWHGTVFDHPDQVELGYCYEKVGMQKPVKIMTVSDEFDDYAPYFPNLGGYAKLAAHEILHGFYGLADKTGLGLDLNHNHWFGQNGNAMRPEDCFNDFDYAKLS